MKLNRLILILFFCSFSLMGEAQDFIVLKKNIKSFRFYIVGNEMDIKLDGEHYWIKARIDSISEKHLVLNGSLIEIASITNIKVRRNNMNYEASGTLLMLAGAVFPLIVGVNITLEDNYHPNPR
ncbi:MAG: hypothetical protein H0X62_04255, partial [Bacteroidetes bacterium]|nr:hypothetical protein [Bacteroidota bacterium]